MPTTSAKKDLDNSVDSTVIKDIQAAAKAMRQGSLVAYPTEAVFGFGCDPMQPQAVEALIKLKNRQRDKGLILIASTFEQLKPYLADIDKALESRAKQTWPGPVTWVWPVNPNGGFTPLLSGRHQSLAVRVTDHPIASALCEEFQAAIVSTSANLEGDEPARTAQQVKEKFQSKLAVTIDGMVGDLLQPTKIFDVMTQAALR